MSKYANRTISFFFFHVTNDFKLQNARNPEMDLIRSGESCQHIAGLVRSVTGSHGLPSRLRDDCIRSLIPKGGRYCLVQGDTCLFNNADNLRNVRQALTSALKCPVSHTPCSWSCVLAAFIHPIDAPGEHTVGASAIWGCFFFFCSPSQ